MEKYTDLDIINDAIDFLSQLQNKPVMTIIEMETPTEAGGGVMHTKMKYFGSSQYIKNSKMIRTLQAVNVEGNYLGIDVKNIRELRVFWNYSKYKLPQNLRDSLLFYPEPESAPDDEGTRALTNVGKLTPPPVRKISIRGKND